MLRPDHLGAGAHFGAAPCRPDVPDALHHTDRLSETSVPETIPPQTTIPAETTVSTGNLSNVKHEILPLSDFLYPSAPDHQTKDGAELLYASEERLQFAGSVTNPVQSLIYVSQDSTAIVIFDIPDGTCLRTLVFDLTANTCYIRGEQKWYCFR